MVEYSSYYQSSKNVIYFALVFFGNVLFFMNAAILLVCFFGEFFVFFDLFGQRYGNHSYFMIWSRSRRVYMVGTFALIFLYEVQMIETLIDDTSLVYCICWAFNLAGYLIWVVDHSELTFYRCWIIVVIIAYIFMHNTYLSVFLPFSSPTSI